MSVQTFPSGRSFIYGCLIITAMCSWPTLNIWHYLLNVCYSILSKLLNLLAWNFIFPYYSFSVCRNCSDVSSFLLLTLSACVFFLCCPISDQRLISFTDFIVLIYFYSYFAFFVFCSLLFLSFYLLWDFICIILIIKKLNNQNQM